MERARKPRRRLVNLRHLMFNRRIYCTCTTPTRCICMLSGTKYISIGDLLIHVLTWGHPNLLDDVQS